MTSKIRRALEIGALLTPLGAAIAVNKAKGSKLDTSKQYDDSKLAPTPPAKLKDPAEFDSIKAIGSLQFVASRDANDQIINPDPYLKLKDNVVQKIGEWSNTDTSASRRQFIDAAQANLIPGTLKELAAIHKEQLAAFENNPANQGLSDKTELKALQAQQEQERNALKTQMLDVQCELFQELAKSQHRYHAELNILAYCDTAEAMADFQAAQLKSPENNDGTVQTTAMPTAKQLLDHVKTIRIANFEIACEKKGDYDVYTARTTSKVGLWNDSRREEVAKTFFQMAEAKGHNKLELNGTNDKFIEQCLIQKYMHEQARENPAKYGTVIPNPLKTVIVTQNYPPNSGKQPDVYGPGDRYPPGIKEKAEAELNKLLAQEKKSLPGKAAAAIKGAYHDHKANSAYKGALKEDKAAKAEIEPGNPAPGSRLGS